MVRVRPVTPLSMRDNISVIFSGVPSGMGNQEKPMVAEFGHRISLRSKVACRYHFPKGHGIGCTDNRSCRIRYGSSENKSGRVGTFPIGVPVALWLSTASSIGAEPKIHPVHRPPGLPRRVRFDGRLRVATLSVAFVSTGARLLKR